MMWLMWHMWVLLALAALAGGVAGWILRGARQDDPLRLPRRDAPQPAPSVSPVSADTVTSAPEPETVAPATPAASASKAGAAAMAGPDELTRIKGLGPKAESTLTEAGVFHFHQIAAWSAADIETFDALLNARGRIVRDDWVGQAKAFAKS